MFSRENTGSPGGESSGRIDNLMTPSKFKPVEEQLEYLKKGVAEIIPEEELKQQATKNAKELLQFFSENRVKEFIDRSLLLWK